jgi:hypothetical protein
MPPQSQKKRSGAPTVAAEAAKRLRLSQQSLSPQEALASQATESPSEPAWETQFLESQPEAEIAAPTEGSHAGTGSDELNDRGDHVCMQCDDILGATVRSEYIEMETG